MAHPNEWDRFRQLQTELPATGPGARHIAIDFHCHTPASDDFEAGTYDDIAGRIVAAGLDAVFVTDHNTWEGYRPLADALAKRNSKAQVYPGVELTIVVNAARVGDGLSREEKKVRPLFYHILVFLPPSVDVEKQIEILVTNNFLNTAILKSKPTERKLGQPLQEVAAQVHKWGGLVLVAHFHQGKAPEDSRSHDDLFVDSLAIKDLINSFDAVEIRKPDADRFFTGSAIGIEGDVIPEKVCVLGSDGHTPDAYGKERTWVLVGENTYDDIFASLHYRERISFSRHPGRRDLLLSLIIEGTFLGHQHFALNDELTALIGTKGSGKSAVLECIRFALGFQAGSGGDAYLNNILGPAGKVWLSARNRDDEEFLFMRGRQDVEPRVWSSDGTSLQRNAVIPSHFSVEIRGWGEVTKLAEAKDAQLRLLDELDVDGVCHKATQDIAMTRATLPDRLRSLAAAVASLRETKEDLDELRLKKSRLERLKVTHLIDEQVHKERRDAEMAGYRALVHELEESEREGAVVIARSSGEQISSFQDAFAAGVLTQELAIKATNAIDSARNEELRLKEAATATLAQLIAELRACIAALELDFAPKEEKYQELFAQLEPSEQAILLARNEIVRDTARLPSVEGRYETQAALLADFLHRYARALDDIQDALVKRSNTRVLRMGELNVRLRDAGIATRYALLPLSRVGGNVPVGSEPAKAFADVANRVRGLTAETAMFESPSRWDSTYREEVSLMIDDVPSIEFELYPGVWRASDQLSAGQKSTAVLPLIVLHGDGPVILDQPEDNLDNKYVGSTVVPMMLTQKSKRQFVIASHNATLVVMSDANLVVQMLDEGGAARIVEDGFLCGPHSPIRGAILEVVDGGEKAMRRRFSRYGLKEDKLTMARRK